MCSVKIVGAGRFVEGTNCIIGLEKPFFCGIITIMKKTTKRRVKKKITFIIEFLIAVAMIAGVLGYRPDFLSDIGQELEKGVLQEATQYAKDAFYQTKAAVESYVKERTDSTYTQASGILEMQVIDVGQGQAVLFSSSGKYMLVDGGDRSSSSYLVSYLKKLGIKELEYIVASHYDDDHLSGLIGALYTFPVRNVIAPGYVADTKTYTSFCNAVSAEGLTAILPKTGDTYTFGEAEFTIVSETELMNQNQDSENNSSVAILVTNGVHSFLVTGDAQEEAEDAMCDNGENLKSDVYVAGHHGSSSSSTEGFLDAVAPELAVISCGKDNAYGHPADRVMDSFQKRDIKVYRTDRDGTVTITSDEKQLSVE